MIGGRWGGQHLPRLPTIKLLLQTSAATADGNAAAAQTAMLRCRQSCYSGVKTDAADIKLTSLDPRPMGGFSGYSTADKAVAADIFGVCGKADAANLLKLLPPDIC
jgi:hypothetical protein